MQSSGAQGSAKPLTQQFTVYLRRDKTNKKAASEPKNCPNDSVGADIMPGDRLSEGSPNAWATRRLRPELDS